jgi:hypothetical protein
MRVWQLKTALALVVLLTLVGAALRVFHLDEVPLRGDEAFTVRFWAEPPGETWSDLAGWEPHPIGTFVIFWAWKSVAGDSEFAMRALPMLVNLLGIALMMALARRLIGAWAAVWMLGLLWTINPFQIWHAQDVRNYALWAVFSPLAMWLFLIAIQRNRHRDWTLYALAQFFAFHAFLLEPFFLLIQGLYLLIFHRERIKPASITWASLAVTLIPWMIQIERLSGSGYGGTAARADLAVLARRFVPTLLFGEGELSLIAGASLLVVLAVGLIAGGSRNAKQRTLLFMWAFLPLLLLVMTSTRLNVFRPRYVIPITPPILLAMMWVAFRAGGRLLPALVTLALASGALISLYAYFYTDPPKAPDWRGLASYLETRSDADDFIILANVDPAFAYYYPGPADELPFSEVGDLQEVLAQHHGVFVQVADSTFDMSLQLQDEAQFIPPAIELVKQYRAWEVDPAEIQHPLALTIGDVAILRGYSVLGGDQFGLTVLLYWEPLRQTETEMVGFLHVTAPGQSAVIAQDDHAPLHGNAPTTAWIPGDLLRDPFAVLLPPGSYALNVGMYESESSQRLEILNVGDAVELQVLILE